MLYFLNGWSNKESSKKGPPPQKEVRTLNSNHILNNSHDDVNVIFVHLQYFICKLSMLYLYKRSDPIKKVEKLLPQNYFGH